MYDDSREKTGDLLKLELYESSVGTWSKFQHTPSVPESLVRTADADSALLGEAWSHLSGKKRLPRVPIPTPWGEVPPKALRIYNTTASVIVHCRDNERQFATPAEDEPLPVIISEAGKQLSCDQCGALALKLNRCSKCKNQWYCGVGCQKLAWKTHKLNCDALRQALLDWQHRQQAAAADAILAAAAAVAQAAEQTCEECEPAEERPAPFWTLAQTSRDLLMQCLTAGSLDARDLGRLQCVARCFTRDIIDDAASRLLVTEAQAEAEQRQAFEFAVLDEHTALAVKQQSEAAQWDWVERPPRAMILEMWGCCGTCDRIDCPGHVEEEDEPGETEFAELREEQMAFQQGLQVAQAQLKRTQERVAAATAGAELEPLARVSAQRRKDERWSQILRRTEKPLLFTSFCETHMSVYMGPSGADSASVCQDEGEGAGGGLERMRVPRGRIARPRPGRKSWGNEPRSGAHAAAVCAEHRMTTGTHRAEFTIGKCDSHITVGIMHANHHPRAHNHGRDGMCKGAFCGRPTDTKSAWGFNSRGEVHHLFSSFEPLGECRRSLPCPSLSPAPSLQLCRSQTGLGRLIEAAPFVGLEGGFGDGDTVRLELDLDGEWGGHVTSRMGNRVRTAKRQGPATRAVLTACKNGERLGEVANFEKRPGAGFFWLAQLYGCDTWLEISRPAGKEFGYGVTKDQVSWATPR